MLSWICYLLFKKGNLGKLYQLFKNVDFSWTILPEYMRIDNYVDYLQVFLDTNHWILQKQSIQEESNQEHQEELMKLISKPSEKTVITEEDVKYVID